VNNDLKTLKVSKTFRVWIVFFDMSLVTFYLSRFTFYNPLYLLLTKESIMSKWESYLEENQARFKEELLDFLRIPSISALPENAQDVERAAEWVANRLKSAGVEKVQILPTGGHPVVYGEWLHAPGKPTILIYGHFDTQPADPLDLWESPPFSPRVEGDNIYARGASDDKGNMLAPILAVEALLKAEGALPVNVKFCFEGQEEIGSPQLPDFMPVHKELFACDMAVSADGGQWSEDEPSILLSLKGACGIQIDLKGAKTDLHSGIYGGTIQNPIHALVRLLDSMRSPDGKIMVEGFYDDVIEFSTEERAEVARVPVDEEVYLDQLGVKATFGEPGYTTQERAWLRPTLEINGIWGGFQGEGTKTVLPNEAHAKITCRLIANQTPEKVIDLLEAHIKKHAPVGVEVNIKSLSIRGKPYMIPPDHPGNEAARAILEELYGKKPYYVRSGGSIPICGVFLDHLNAHTVNFGFGLQSDGAHAPNEVFTFSRFKLGQTAYCKLLYRLAEVEL
jgi:acetylornithine deacetylase/succinyl-diaminopimelate desuccinylase-like protein